MFSTLLLSVLWLALTTAITCALLLTPKALEEAKRLNPEGFINKSFRGRLVARLLLFGFFFVGFPILMLVLVNDDYHSIFSKELSEGLSKA